MRAREFIMEQRAHLPDTAAMPMQHTYFIPGIRNNDAYHAYRLGVAFARARADVDPESDRMPPFTSVSAFGQNAVVSGFNDNVEGVLEKALQLTDTPGGVVLVGSKESEEPGSVNDQSIAKPFAGYPR